MNISIPNSVLERLNKGIRSEKYLMDFSQWLEAEYHETLHNSAIDGDPLKRGKALFINDLLNSFGWKSPQSTFRDKHIGENSKIPAVKRRSE